jgi:hypothetical protein
MSKLPRYKGILLQHIYDDKLIQDFIKRHGWGHLTITKEMINMLYKSRAHSKRLTRAYNKTRIKKL